MQYFDVCISHKMTRSEDVADHSAFGIGLQRLLLVAGGSSFKVAENRHAATLAAIVDNLAISPDADIRIGPDSVEPLASLLDQLLYLKRNLTHSASNVTFGYDNRFSLTAS